MPYFPKSRVITNLKANLGEFTTKDGKDYVGDYFITYDGKQFTGKNPQDVLVSPLIRITENNSIPSKLIVSRDSLIFNSLNKGGVNILEFKEPTQFYPSPTKADYSNNKITRYFAKQRTIRQFQIIEIDKLTYEDLSSLGGIYNYPLWKPISLLWRISESLSKDKTTHKFQETVKGTNQRILDIKEKSFSGIKQYLTNLEQFSKP